MRKLIFLTYFLTICFYCFAAEEAAVQQQLEGFNLNGYTDGGTKSWDINGDTADISDKDIKINNVNANSYGKQNTNLTAKTGTIDKVSGNVHLEKDVVITSKERGTQLTTDSLDWKRNEDLVKTKDPVQIKDKAMTLTGTGMTAHPNLKTAEISQDVVADVKTISPTVSGSGQAVSITCDGPMELDQLRQSAVFNKNVVAIEKSSGRELRADKVEVYFDQKNSKIKRMVCTGNVSVRQGNSVTYAEVLTYDASDQKMTLSGRPRLVLDIAAGGDSPFKGLGEKSKK